MFCVGVLSCVYVHAHTCVRLCVSPFHTVVGVEVPMSGLQSKYGKVDYNISVTCYTLSSVDFKRFLCSYLVYT